MGYQALLFCPDDKTARTVTQVLSELEFNVEACAEPFAAVKKLMGEHFDAVVVDCDNEQNATLLFKSARNSTSNQTSLAVAVVEGQAGVAKAFRIGANLVLTKPINIEQAKGTLRVARGLLRKAEPAKPGVPVATPAPATPAAMTAAPAAKPTPKPVSAARPVPAAKPVAPTTPAAPASAPAAPSTSKPIPTVKPAAAPAWPAAATAKTASAAQASDLFEKPAEKPANAGNAPTAALPSVSKSDDTTIEKRPAAPTPTAATSTPVSSALSSVSVSGAASAPAPAREPVAPTISEPPAKGVTDVKSTEPAASNPSQIVGSAPTFGFGEAAESESSGGSKKIFVGIAAAVVFAAVAYFGWAQYKNHSNTAVTTSAPAAQPITATTQPARSAAPMVPGATTSAPQIETATSATASPTNVKAENEPVKESAKENASHPAPSASKSSTLPTSAPSKPAEKEQPEEAPLMVKSGKVPATHSKAVPADAPAPSMVGIATPDAAPPPNLVPSTSPSFKPVLQSVNVSQGVSQGLLYRKVSPTYPLTAMRMRIEGKVELMATISKEGNITQIKVLSGDRQLVQAATEAVKQWKYKPYLLNGEPVEIQTQVTINFKLPN